MSLPANPRLCPLCRRANQCGALTGAERCWCHDVKVPAELLARIPAAERRTACLCRECIETFARENTPPAPPPAR